MTFSRFCLLLSLILSAESACRTGDLTELEQAALEKHNELRRLHQDTPDLCYGESGEDVAFSAGAWAEVMASDMEMSHSTKTEYADSSNPYGENLAQRLSEQKTMPEGRAYLYFSGRWHNEIRFWDFSSSTGEKGRETRHFTQLVWKGTRQVNCGYATYFDNPNHGAMVVCQYYPAGNRAKAFEENVRPLKSEDGVLVGDGDDVGGGDDVGDGEGDGTDGDGEDGDGVGNSAPSVFSATKLGLVVAAIYAIFQNG